MCRLVVVGSQKSVSATMSYIAELFNFIAFHLLSFDAMPPVYFVHQRMKQFCPVASVFLVRSTVLQVKL